jgi:PAS domain S-box-containing protein
MKTSAPFAHLNWPSSHRLRALGIFFLGITIIWGITLYLVQNAEKSSLVIAMDRSRLLSRSFAEQARATARLIDLAATQIADDWSADPVQFARQVGRTQKKISDITIQVGVVNSEGMLIYSDLGLPPTPLSLKDREHVRVHLDGKDDTLFISRPLKGRVSKKWSIQFTRPIRREGRNIGVVVLSVEPGYFVRHFETFNVGEGGVIALVRHTGELMARGPVSEDYLGTVFKASPYLSANAATEGNFHQRSQADGVPRTYGYTRLAEFGLIAVAGVSDADALSAYFSQRKWIISTATGLSLALLLLIITIVRPLEERERRALDLARSSEESFQLLVNGVTDYAIIKLDHNGFVSQWNAGAKRIKGYSADEIIGSHYSCFFTPQDVSKGLPREGLRIATERGRFEDTGYRLGKSGLQFWANEVITALWGPTGQPAGFAVVTRDITERRKAEEEMARVDQQLREAQKLEGIGQLTGGLAHDFNNLLGIVVGNLDLIGEHLPDNERLQRQHKTALDAALRGAEVTRSLLAVARRQPLEVKEYDINTLIQEMLPLLRSSAGSSVTIDLDFSSGKLPAMLDAGGLSQVVLNLVNNARDAMKNSTREKKLTIRTAKTQVRSNEIPQLSPGKYAVLEVTDTGSGMSESIRQQAFEPFFTTKERGQGTGLGLAMVYGYSTQLGGSASIASTDENGTTVRILLPMHASEVIDDGQDSSTENLKVNHADAASLSHTRVLIVDDEASLCDLASAWIESLGYSCSIAQSPQVALRLLDEQPYDVMFTDIVMPGPMDGTALAREALKRQPQLRVLFASGYSPLLKGGDLPGPILNKPYRKQQLHQALGALLVNS